MKKCGAIPERGEPLFSQTDAFGIVLQEVFCIPYYRDDRGGGMSAVIGVAGLDEASVLAYLGLYAQQHRGDRKASIVSCHRGNMVCHSVDGWVSKGFTEEHCRDELVGRFALGYNGRTNAEASVVTYQRAGERETLAMVYEGAFFNASALRAEFMRPGVVFERNGAADTLLRLIAYSDAPSLFNRVIETFWKVQGAYAALVLTEDSLIAVRGPHGVWSLHLGKKEGGWVVATESCVFDLVEAEYVRELAPGEVLCLTACGMRSYFPFAPRNTSARCSFEPVYFARPDSLFDGVDVHSLRRAFGRQLATEAPVAADIVVPMPDIENPVAISYAEALGLSFEPALIRNHYTNSTDLITPASFTESDLDFRRKISAVGPAIRGKRVVVLDDSLIQGVNGEKLVRLVRRLGAREVHVRICFPPMRYRCPYGGADPGKEKLVAADCSVEEIRARLGADSLAFLSHEGMRRILEEHGGGHCFACVTGSYPLSVPE